MFSIFVFKERSVNRTMTSLRCAVI